MDNNEKDIIEKDIVDDVFGNVEESYDVPVYEPIADVTPVEPVKEETEEEIPVIEDIEPVIEETPAFEENTPVEAVETPIYEMPTVEPVQPVETVGPVMEEVQPVQPEPTVEYNYDVKPEVDEQSEVAPVPLEPNYEEEAPFTEEEMSNGVEHPNAKVTLQTAEEEVKEEVSNEDLKINLNDNASLKFVLIIGIIIFIAIMILPLTNLI